MSIRPSMDCAHDIAALYTLHGPRLRRILRAKLSQGQRRTGTQPSVIGDLIHDVFARLLAFNTNWRARAIPGAYRILTDRSRLHGALEAIQAGTRDVVLRLPE